MNNSVVNNPPATSPAGHPAPSSLPMDSLPLRDIHLPDPVSAWPPGMGWWLLPLLLAILAYGIYSFIKYRNRQQKIAYKKMARRQLAIITQQYKRDNQPIETLRALSTLLRRIALSYLPREEVASLTGEAWIKQLNQLGSQAVFTEEQIQLLTHAAYQKPDKINLSTQVSALLESCENWIRQLPRQGVKSGAAL